MSADIIPFIPRRNRRSGRAEFPVPASPPHDLVMDHVDTAPCEYVWPEEGDTTCTENINA